MTPTFVNFNNGTGNTVYENTSYTRDIWLAAFKGGSEFQAPFREYEEGSIWATAGMKRLLIWDTLHLITCRKE